MIKVTHENLSTLKEGYGYIMQAKGQLYLFKCLDLYDNNSFQCVQLSMFTVWSDKGTKEEVLNQGLNDDRCEVFALKFKTMEDRFKEAFNL